MIDCWRSADQGAGWDIRRYSTLRRHNRIVSDFAVANHSHLPSEDDAVANLGGSGNANLRSQ